MSDAKIVSDWLVKNGPADIRAVAKGTGISMDAICRLKGDKWDRSVNPPLLVSVWVPEAPLPDPPPESAWVEDSARSRARQGFRDND